jgi:hypothetical protein
MKAADRLFAFTAETPAIMLKWVAAIDAGVKGAKKQMKEFELNRVAAVKPEIIRIFDERGAIALADRVKQDCMSIINYNAEDEITEDVVTERLEMASDLVEYIEDLRRDVKPDPKYAATNPELSVVRYDVLAIGMVEINRWLFECLQDLVTPDAISTYSLATLHRLIEWISRYEAMMKKINALSVHLPDLPRFKDESTGKRLFPTKNPIFKSLSRLCDRYVNGGDGVEGAAAHLADHCSKVWDNFLVNPVEAIQRHKDGSFFTNSPIDTWEALNQHLSLATSTNCSILHVYIADKISKALLGVIRVISTYVQELDTSQNEAIAEVEIELICALANDMALHFEEIAQLIDNVPHEEIQQRVDALFDETTTNLVQCGQICLRRLSALVMNDIKDRLENVFTEEWLSEDADNVKVAIATASDYLSDLKVYLVPFWSGRMTQCVLEEFVTTYAKTIVSRGVLTSKTAVTAAPIAAPVNSSAAPTTSFSKFSSMFGAMSKQMTKAMEGGTEKLKTMSTAVMEQSVKRAGIAADTDSTNQIGFDIKEIYKFFHGECEEEAFNDTLAIIEDILEFLSAGGDRLGRLMVNRMNQYPPSLQCVVEVARRLISLRDDLDADEINDIFEPIEPMLQVHTQDEEWVYGTESIYKPRDKRIGTMYKNIVPTKRKLSERLKEMTNLTMLMSKVKALPDVFKDLDMVDEPEESEEALALAVAQASAQSQVRRKSFIKQVEETNHSLLDDVADVLMRDDEELEAHRLAIEEEKLRAQALLDEQTRLAASAGPLLLEGVLDKRSPKTNMWQERFFKLMAKKIMRDQDEDEGGLGFDYVYSFMWFKKKGGSVLNSVDAANVTGMKLLRSPRQVAYLPMQDCIKLAVEANTEDGTVVNVRECAGADFDAGSEGYLNRIGLGAGGGGTQYFAFALTTSSKSSNADGDGDEDSGPMPSSGDTGGGKDIILRTTSVDDLIRWMNGLAQGLQLTFDSSSGQWRARDM